MVLDYTLFELFGHPVRLGQLVNFLLLGICLYAFHHIIVRIILTPYLSRKDYDQASQRKLFSIFSRIILSLLLIAFIVSLDLNPVIYQTDRYSFHLSAIILGLVVVQIARLIDWFTSKVLMQKYYSSRQLQAERIDSHPHHQQRVSNTMQYIVYLIAALILVSNFDLNSTLFVITVKENTFPFRISSVITILLIFLTARLLSWIVTQLILFSYYRRTRVDPGRRYAVNQLVTYFIYMIAIFVTIDNIGIDLTVLWGGLAALAVGIGLGMQDVFKDFVSGIVLLSERSVEVNDVVNVNGRIGKIKKIGLRTSLMRGRDDTMLILPNSSLISNNVMNWTHLDRQVRFSVKVRVAYGTNTALVRSILLDIASKNKDILNYPPPFVRLIDFGDYSLDFELFFWSEVLMDIENVLSDVRFAVNEALIRQNITIPFPQHDIWLKRNPDDRKPSDPDPE